MLELLVNKIPTAELLLSYENQIKRLVICNREESHSITVKIFRNYFYDLCSKNNIQISEKLKNILDLSLYVGVDVDSLFEDTYRFYIDNLDLRFLNFWYRASQYPLEAMSVSQLYQQNQAKLDNISSSEQRLIDADANYPIILVKDKLGSYGVFDGMHRIKKAYDQNQDTINAYIIPIDEIDQVRFDNNYNKYFDENILWPDVVSLFSKIKSTLEGKNKEVFGDNEILIVSVGIYFNKNDNTISLYKFYFTDRDNNLIVQHKFLPNGAYQGSFFEDTQFDSTKYKDTLNITTEFDQEDVTLWSASRRDKNQSYFAWIRNKS